jgi:hypothetical protein
LYVVDVGRLTGGVVVVGLGLGFVVVGFVVGLVAGRLVSPPIMPPPVIPPESCCATALLVTRNIDADKQSKRGNAFNMEISPVLDRNERAIAAVIIVKNGFRWEQLLCLESFRKVGLTSTNALR